MIGNLIHSILGTPPTPTFHGFKFGKDGLHRLPLSISFLFWNPVEKQVEWSQGSTSRIQSHLTTEGQDSLSGTELPVGKCGLKDKGDSHFPVVVFLNSCVIFVRTYNVLGCTYLPWDCVQVHFLL